MSDNLTHNAIDKLFAERKDFIIIGLTGRTGSGCSTVAGLLSKIVFETLQPPEPESYLQGDIAQRQYKIVYDYLKQEWKPFVSIEMKNVLFIFILENNFEKFSSFIKEEIDSDSAQSEGMLQFQQKYTELHNKGLSYKKKGEECNIKGENVPADDEIYKYYFENVPDFCEEVKNQLGLPIFTNLFQKIGDNIRASGEAFTSEPKPDNMFHLAQHVNMLIKILRRRNLKERKGVCVVIDAFRNPYEVLFFKDRYSSFYLFSINAEDNERKDRLREKGLDDKKIIDLDKKEYPPRTNCIEGFSQINIGRTIELADVHLYNPDNKSKTYDVIKKQLVRYVSLIMHPGLVPPTQEERCMQIAYDSKLNSGCLSRQVGAVITDKDYNILANGWNSAPSGQIPCSLRSVFAITREDQEDKLGMSEFEKTDREFKSFIKKNFYGKDFSVLKGRNCSYCFKDAYNALKKAKNQVYTRAIHAEEMAFLQVAKISNGPVQDGYLFTTASPCELCSKKAYHLGISKIYYIDPYPGISDKHILSYQGKAVNMSLFKGAIGRAYTQLYSQVLPYKDELYILLSLEYGSNET